MLGIMATQNVRLLHECFPQERKRNREKAHKEKMESSEVDRKQPMTRGMTNCLGQLGSTNSQDRYSPSWTYQSVDQ